MATKTTKLGSRITALREGKGMTRHDLAATLKVNPVTVWRWERDHRSPDPDQLQRIAEALEATSEELLGW